MPAIRSTEEYDAVIVGPGAERRMVEVLSDIIIPAMRSREVPSNRGCL